MFDAVSTQERVYEGVLPRKQPGGILVRYPNPTFTVSVWWWRPVFLPWTFSQITEQFTISLKEVLSNLLRKLISIACILNLFYSLPTACGRTLDYSFCVNIQYTVDQNTKGLWTIVGPVHISYKSCDKLLETLDSLYCETTLCRVFFFCSGNTSSRVNNHHIYTFIRDKPDSTPYKMCHVVAM